MTPDTAIKDYREAEVHRFLTVPEVATRLRCSKAHVYNLINGIVSGMEPLPAVRLGRRALVLQASLNQWVIRCEHRQKLTPQDA
jgi:excisionase family DNA binding protein